MSPMFTFLSVALVTGTFIWFVNKFHKSVGALADRLVTVAERKVDIAEQTEIKKPLPKGEEAPIDLVNMAASLTTPWAREDALKRLHELRDELGDWGHARDRFLSEMS